MKLNFAVRFGPITPRVRAYDPDGEPEHPELHSAFVS